MRFSSISINLLDFFRIISFVFDLKYLSQNLINLNMLGVFWNPQDEQILKVSLDLRLEQHLRQILRVYTSKGHGGHHCMFNMSLKYYLFHLKHRCDRNLMPSIKWQLKVICIIPIIVQCKFYISILVLMEIHGRISEKVMVMT